MHARTLCNCSFGQVLKADHTALSGACGLYRRRARISQFSNPYLCY
ncbi:hypothetical protein C4K04_4366 [Pseudomonas chlororaphis]|uniref:Uncharacterized protein n=1 Tax=Pseudomonas chlororaphis TaxID=587753 RepID=A0A3G7TSG6_9PSED|nr:hypothetical protein C4K04_4366 [Pseudomonas chlororaphis]